MKILDKAAEYAVTAGLIMSAGAMNDLTFITGVILLLIGLSVRGRTDGGKIYGKDRQTHRTR